MIRGLLLGEAVLEVEMEILGLGLVDEVPTGLREPPLLPVSLGLLTGVMDTVKLLEVVVQGERVALAEVEVDAVKLSVAVPQPVLLPASETVGVSVAAVVDEAEADLQRLAVEEGLGVLLGEREGE